MMIDLLYFFALSWTIAILLTVAEQLTIKSSGLTSKHLIEFIFINKVSNIIKLII